MCADTSERDAGEPQQPSGMRGRSKHPVQMGCLTIIVGAFVGALAGWIVGAATAPPPDPSMIFDQNTWQPVEFAFWGFLIGSAVALIGLAVWAVRLRRQRG